MTTRRELREHTFCMLFSGGFYEPEEARDQADRYIRELSEMNEDDAGEREWKKLPGIPNDNVVDTEGAGDWTTAAIINGIARSGKPFGDLDEEEFIYLYYSGILLS